MDHGLGERRVLGKEPPAGPHGVGIPFSQSRDHALHVQIRLALPSGATRELDGSIGMSNEGCIALDLRVEDERSQVAPLAPAQRLDAAETAHGGLAAIRDAEAADPLQAATHCSATAKAAQRP
jgi:hypothetical protein